ncbi:iojap-like ribosome-associated protein [Rubrobacter radiotolerans]|uniref:Ribosomal silencing factor RsfS n=1 Tax=Rubrobacter radiotolerans TaxID=42256 RepID=A0A023X3N4_RUBRA|nr:ribosome silencing factor [Rubrobacter radiotolerans]AHY46811.1 iojap-like ribosome-associated protein [Rubrobacter radiotolerans]MDX5894218.1 ribosome silencing factor [Rubrobacter radiotolerans]SMC05491.1 ribosome-associated protein [Rubrobacter radiotolerans DSM 5868]
MMGDESASGRHETDRSLEGEALTYSMAVTAAEAANEMFGKDITIIDLKDHVSYTDYFVVTSAETDRQTKRIAEEVIEKMISAGHRPRSRRLDENSQWLSLDFVDVVVHVFTDEARDYYRLESLWRSAPQEKWGGWES